MTNKPEPNTRAGEVLKPCPFCGSNKIYADQYVRDGSGITCGDCNTKIWEYHGPPHMPSPQDRCRVRWNTRPLPQPSELVERPSEAIEVLGGPYRQLDMDGVIVGVSRQAIYETLTYLTQLEAQITKLQADTELRL